MVYTDNSYVHLGSMSQGYGYYGQGHGPAHVDGVYLNALYDDGSEEWADLFDRAQQHPVRTRRDI